MKHNRLPLLLLIIDKDIGRLFLTDFEVLDPTRKLDSKYVFHLAFPSVLQPPDLQEFFIASPGTKSDEGITTLTDEMVFSKDELPPNVVFGFVISSSSFKPSPYSFRMISESISVKNSADAVRIYRLIADAEGIEESIEKEVLEGKRKRI